jgi:hypothetical protein
MACLGALGGAAASAACGAACNACNLVTHTWVANRYAADTLQDLLVQDWSMRLRQGVPAKRTWSASLVDSGRYRSIDI